MGLLDWAEEKANSVQSFASGIADRVSSTASAIAGAVGSGIDTAAGAVGSAAQAMGESIGARATSLAQTVSGAASGAAAIAQKATAAVAAQAEARVTALANNVQATAKAVASGVGKGAGAVAAGVGSLAGSIAGRVQKVEAGIAKAITDEAKWLAGNYRRNTGALADVATQGAGLWAKLTMGAERAIGSGVLAAAGVAREYGGETGAAVADWAVAKEAQVMANAARNTAAVVHWVDVTGHAIANGFANTGDLLANGVVNVTNFVSTRAQARAGQIAGLVASGTSGIAGLVQTGAGAIANGVGAIASGAAGFANKRIKNVAGMYVRGFGAVGEGVGALAGKAAVAVRDGAAAVGKGIGMEAGDVAAFLKGQAGAIASNVGAGVGYLAGQVGRRAHDLAHGLERGVAFASEQTGLDLDAMATRTLVGIESTAQGVRSAYESARTQAEQAALGILRAAQDAATPITGPMGAALAKVRSGLMERAAQAQAAVQAMTERGRKALSGFALLKSQAIAQAMAAKAKAREIAAQTLAAAKELPILKAAGRAFDFVKGLLHAGGEKVSGGVGVAKDLVSKGIGFVKGIPGMLRPNTDEVETLADGSSRTHTDGEVTGPFVPASFKGTPKEKEWAGKGARAALAGGAALFVNGIKYSYKQHAAAAQRMANELGVVVVGVWNATGAGHGGVGELRDWIQCASDKLNDLGGNPAVATVRGIIEEHGDARKPNGGLRLLAHSQGSIIVSEAMRQAKKGGVDIRNNDVSTFGNAAWTVPDGATYRHFVFAGDAISNSVGSVGIGTGPLGFLSELAGFRSTGRDTRVMEHASWNPIRQHGLNDGAEDGGADYISATSGAILDDWAKDPRWAGRGGYEAPTKPGAPIPKAPAFTPHMLLRGAPLSPLGGGGKTLPNQIKGWMPSLVRSWLGDPDQGARDGGSKAPPGLAKRLNSKFKIQRSGDGPAPDVDAGGLRDRLIRQGGPGFAPDAGMRERLSGHLGFDPGGARLHTHAAGAAAAAAMNAHAFTVGNDVFFGAGRFDPHSPQGAGLIAHELTHVGQQTGAGEGPLQFKGGHSGFGDMEQAAQRVGETVALAHGARESMRFESLQLEVLGEDQRNGSNRLDAIYGLSVAEASRRLEADPIRGLNLDQLDVDIELDLDSMTDDQCVEVWAGAIVAAARRKGGSRPARNPAPTIQRYESGEHSQLGGTPGGTQTAVLVNGVWLTHGEIIAMGDFYATPADMLKASKEELTRLQELINKDQAHYLDPSKPEVGTSDWEGVIGDRYLELAGKNDSHFTPDNVDTWKKHHAEAYQFAQQGEVVKAHTYAYFGEHFLTDAFSAGHVFKKKEVFDGAKAAVEAIGKPEFLNRLSGALMRANPQLSGFEVPANPKTSAIFGGHGGNWQPANQTTLIPILELVESQQGDKLYSMFVKLVHDRLNSQINRPEGGLLVENARGDKWQMSGDGSLAKSPKTAEVARGATKTSEDAIKTALDWKKRPEWVNRPWSRVFANPFADFDYPGWVAKVMAYVPHPVANDPNGAGAVAKERADALNLDRPETWDAIGALSRQEFPTLQTTLEGKHLLRRAAAAPVQRKEGSASASGSGSQQTGLPDALKAGVESLSGASMDDVRVHYNSSRPSSMGALAYAQGTDIHVAPGQEAHLPHEAWHVVQQKQGRVKPTRQLKGAGVNDNSALEAEADAMGARAMSGIHGASIARQVMAPRLAPVMQRKDGLTDAQVATMSLRDKMAKAIEYSQGFMAAAAWEQIKGSIPWIVGGVIALIAAQFVPVLDIILDIGLAIAMGWQIISVIRQCKAFYDACSAARTDADLRNAGKIFADIVATVGITALFALFSWGLKRGAAKKGSTRAAPETKPVVPETKRVVPQPAPRAPKAPRQRPTRPQPEVTRTKVKRRGTPGEETYKTQPNRSGTKRNYHKEGKYRDEDFRRKRAAEERRRKAEEDGEPTPQEELDRRHQPTSEDRIASLLKRFRTEEFYAGGYKVRVDRAAMKHFLEGHHRRTFNKNTRVGKHTTSFLDRNMDPQRIILAIKEVCNQNFKRIQKMGVERGQVEGVVNGQRYVVGFNRGRVGQFYPK